MFWDLKKDKAFTYSIGIERSSDVSGLKVDKLMALLVTCDKKKQMNPCKEFYFLSFF